MTRYKEVDTSPRFLAVDLEKPLLPGSFEYAVHHLLEREFDLSVFDRRYRNDRSGVTAYPLRLRQGASATGIKTGDGQTAIDVGCPRLLLVLAPPVQFVVQRVAFGNT